MECNKEDALRAREMAEKKFFERDLSGAKRFAIMAQKLFPGLDGLSQFVATLDMYISVDERAYGEIDWYRVLGVEPSADEDTIRKHYRKLALILHPDKNKSVGAEGAFKILCEAWTVLSDKVKRSAYDHKRNLWAMYLRVTNYKSSTPTGQNGFHYFFNNNKSNSATRKSAMNPKPAPPQHFSKLDTFWTICNYCKLQFEYLRTYINHNLFCQNCRQPFYAVEMPPPPLNGKSTSSAWTSCLRGQNSTQYTRKENAYASGKKPVSTTNMGPVSQSGTFAKVGSAGTMPSAGPTTAVRGESLHRKIHTFKEAGTNVASESSTAGVFTSTKGGRLKKIRRFGEGMSFTAIQMANGNGVGDSGILKTVFETGRGRFAGSQKFNRTRELSQLELRSMLMDKAKKNISMKLKDCDIPSAVSKTSEGELEEKGKQKAHLNGMKADGSKCPEFVDTKTRTHTKSFLANSNDDHDTKDADAVSMIVPDPDFYDFDKDRTEKSFGDNQVWAAYDDDDGMPRYYAMIHSVISLKPFKVRISWLNSKNNRELSPLNWIGSGFFKTSGDFWMGKHEVKNSLNSFSHKVNKWAKGVRGTIQIYPRKGDIWALYRNWSSDWNELTPDEVIHEYDMVEVLEDYNMERGVTIAPLVKVAGFKTVFHRHSDSRKTKAIPREELFRLSHQVPSYLLTGQEGHNAPRGCWELDPASMPLELLKVLAEEVEEEEMVENADETKDPVKDVNESEEEQLMENSEMAKDTGAAKDAAKEDVAEMRKGKRKEIKGDELLVYKRRRDRK